MFEEPNTFPLCFIFLKGTVLFDNDRHFREEAKIMKVLPYSFPWLELATFGNFFTMSVANCLLQIHLLLNSV